MQEQVSLFWVSVSVAIELGQAVIGLRSSNRRLFIHTELFCALSPMYYPASSPGPMVSARPAALKKTPSRAEAAAGLERHATAAASS